MDRTTIIPKETMERENNVCDRDQCTGCGACYTVCPLNCITMATDNEGFYYPSIDLELCIRCGKCKSTCPSLGKKQNPNNIETRAFAFVNSDLDTLSKSSSGGFFSAIAEWVFMKNGIVYGCKYDENFNAVFCKAESLEEIEIMRGSKYVESKAWTVYMDIKHNLSVGRIVLFVALPCQVAGLLSVISETERDNLYMVDLLCHGVPSHKLFESYISYLANKEGELQQYSFRDKKYWGWGSWGTYSVVSNGKRKEKKLLVANDYYYSLYFRENNYRESCYRCDNASLPRKSDLTIGDCWNIEEMNESIRSRDGVSLVLVNSEKGSKAFADISNKHLSIPLQLEDVKKYNKTIVMPSNRPEERDDFYKDFCRLGFEKTANKYCKLKKFIPVLARYIPKNLKRNVKRWIKRGAAK